MFDIPIVQPAEAPIVELAEAVPVLMLPPAAEAIPFIYLPPPPTELPQSIRDMARAAFEASDDQALDTIIKMARKTFPDADRQTDALAAQYGSLRAERVARLKREREARLAAASVFDNWSGELELGGSLSTGNTESLGLYGALKLSREGLRWQHQVKGRIDFQSSDGETIADRLSFGWEPGYKLNEGMYIYGLGQFERDRFLGFSSRFTLSTGVGMALVDRPDLKVTLQGGPAVRRVDYVDGGSEIHPAGRASAGLRWKLGPSLELSQDAAFYLEEGSTNAIATTGLETKLLGALKARLSYNFQYEDGDPDGRKPIDTTSRVTLVYSF